ncbi:hypothetical protein A6R68_00814, partial [Neotoma lepida]
TESEELRICKNREAKIIPHGSFACFSETVTTKSTLIEETASGHVVHAWCGLLSRQRKQDTPITHFLYFGFGHAVLVANVSRTFRQSVSVTSKDRAFIRACQPAIVCEKQMQHTEYPVKGQTLNDVEIVEEGSINLFSSVPPTTLDCKGAPQTQTPLNGSTMEDINHHHGKRNTLPQIIKPNILEIRHLKDDQCVVVEEFPATDDREVGEEVTQALEAGHSKQQQVLGDDCELGKAVASVVLSLGDEQDVKEALNHRSHLQQHLLPPRQKEELITHPYSHATEP